MLFVRAWKMDFTLRLLFKKITGIEFPTPHLGITLEAISILFLGIKNRDFGSG